MKKKKEKKNTVRGRGRLKLTWMGRRVSWGEAWRQGGLSWGKSFLAEGPSKCKGPEAGALVCGQRSAMWEMGVGDPPSLPTGVAAEGQGLCVSITWGLGGREGLALASVLATCLLGCIMRCVHPLSFQTQRQYIEATNESNRIFLYCAFLDFRYRLCGRVPRQGGGREGDRGSGENREGGGQDVRARSHTRPDYDLLLLFFASYILLFVLHLYFSAYFWCHFFSAVDSWCLLPFNFFCSGCPRELRIYIFNSLVSTRQ